MVRFRSSNRLVDSLLEVISRWHVCICPVDFKVLKAKTLQRNYSIRTANESCNQTPMKHILSGVNTLKHVVQRVLSMTYINLMLLNDLNKHTQWMWRLNLSTARERCTTRTTNILSLKTEDSSHRRPGRFIKFVFRLYWEAVQVQLDIHIALSGFFCNYIFGAHVEKIYK